MDAEPLFTGNDLKLVQSLKYDPSLKPKYHMMKGCLVWDDEKIDNLTPMGYENLGDLWIVRGYLHRGLDLSSTLDPAYFQDVWERALKQLPDWPGFKRLELNEEDRALLEHSMHEMAEAERQGLDY